MSPIGQLPPRQRWAGAVVALVLLGIAFGLRWPSFSTPVWNLDEAIHAAAARQLLDGGVMYRDAIDQRSPLTYYAVAAVFLVAGENNMGAVHALVAALVAAAAWFLWLAGRRLAGGLAGAAAALLYLAVASAFSVSGDAHAANTEWFAVVFTSAAAALFAAGATAWSLRRLAGVGALIGLGALCKQPVLLDLLAPAAAVAYSAWLGREPWRQTLRRLAALGGGFLLPVVVTAAYFAAHGVFGDLVFYTWTYNLLYYGPEIAAHVRFGTLVVLLRLLADASWPFLLLALGSAGVLAHRVVQRTPQPEEREANPLLLHLGVWTLTGLAGAVSGGRGFDHYLIQVLPPLCLLAATGAAALWRAASARGIPARAAAAVVLAVVLATLGSSALRVRATTAPPDVCREVSQYMRDHSGPADRVFAWGFQPEVYLFSNRRPASRFLYASFVTGFIPWSNGEPGRDTAYAIVPGALDSLLEDLRRHRPAFIVDCSAGPNRCWDKYPFSHYPRLAAYVNEYYEVVEGPRFVAQGFRLYARRRDGAATAADGSRQLHALPVADAAAFAVTEARGRVAPAEVLSSYGAGVELTAGRREFSLHAPAVLRYALPRGARLARGGFGLRPGAYAAENRFPTDGATFEIVIGGGGTSRTVYSRTLKPATTPEDRGLQTFEAELPAAAGATLEFRITPGPSGNYASDWTYWSDLVIETGR